MRDNKKHTWCQMILYRKMQNSENLSAGAYQEGAGSGRLHFSVHCYSLLQDTSPGLF